MNVSSQERKYGRLAIVAICATVLVIPLASFQGNAAPKISLEARDTWDADMINSDITGYTGKGVYVAVLDTGLAPNWKDYFPVGSIAADLGKGFKEEIKWDSATKTFVESGTVHEISWIGDIGSTHGT